MCKYNRCIYKFITIKTISMKVETTRLFSEFVGCEVGNGIIPL